MPTPKTRAALEYFEPLVQEVYEVITAVQADIQDPENSKFLADLLLRLQKGWDVLGYQIVRTSHCQECHDTGVLSTKTAPAIPCPECSVGTSVDEQAAELCRVRQLLTEVEDK